MKELIKQYLDNGMSRRQLMTGLSALGMSTVAAKSVAQSLETFGQGAAAPRSAMREMKGTGGALFVQQLKAAGVEHIFFNPSTGDYPIFDALVDEPGIQLIKGIHEGAVVAMADGYARASGKTGVVIVANIGLPNAMTQMVNSWKDQIPVMVAVASVEQDALGRDLFQEPDHVRDHDAAHHQVVLGGEDDGLDPGNRPPRHEVRVDVALRPGVPLAADQYAARGGDRHHLGPGQIRRADAHPSRQGRHREGRAHSARSQEPADERRRRGHLVPRRQGAGRARRVARPARHRAGGQSLGFWSKPFPTRHPLYVGPQLRDMRYPGKVDVLLNLGNRYGERAAPGTQLISIRLDPTSLARGAPVDLGMVADLRLATADLVAAIRGMATPTRLREIAEERTARTRAYTARDVGVPPEDRARERRPHAGQPRAHRARARSARSTRTPATSATSIPARPSIR